MKLEAIIANIDHGALALPQFQRGYVWNRAQVRGLMESLYRGHPVGSLLTWLTATEAVDFKGETPPTPGSVQLLLDGQQRMSTLYGLIKGEPPPFFEGNTSAFTDLRFHLEDETFEFWQPIKMGDDPFWLDVHQLFAQGAAASIGDLYKTHAGDPRMDAWIERIGRIVAIRDRDFHIEQVAGADKTVDVVVDIFNRVNSGGTKLSKGDLALAKICAEWPEARLEMRAVLDEWAKRGLTGFSVDWLLRAVTAILTEQSRFEALADITPEQFRDGLKRTKQSLETVLNALASRLGVNDASVLPSAPALIPLARFADRNGNTLGDHAQRDRLLYWYMHAAMWGRYAGPVETVLRQDLKAVGDGASDPTDELLARFKQQRGDLVVRPTDFIGWSRGSRFYPMLYILTRVTGACDWGTGEVLSKAALGSHTDLEVHHIFPKSLLYEAGYSRAEVNAVANFTFLTKQTNLEISNRPTADYLPEYRAKHPGAVEGHWVPMDPELWAISSYPEFLAARRELLASALNEFLSELHDGHVPDTKLAQVGIGADEGAASESQQIAELREWLVENLFDAGKTSVEIPATGNHPSVVLDVAWPSGVQPELTEPVALLIDESVEVWNAAAAYGYRVFVSAEALRDYCQTLLFTQGLAPASVSGSIEALGHD
jgi:hypothetical protein